MEPIAKRLNQSAEAALTTAKHKANDDVADQIKRLEAELQQSGDSSDEDEDDSSDEDSSDNNSDDGDAVAEKTSTKKRKTVLSLSAYANERVEALPEHLLPKATATAANLTDKKRKRVAQEPPNTNNGSLLDVMQWPKKVPFACKPCGFVGKDMDDFNAHRESEAHASRQQNVGTVLMCKLCDKKFTSPQQLEDHKVGKWHLQRSQQRKERHIVKVCYDFMRGSCKWGDRCNFDHTETKAVKSGKAIEKAKKRPCDGFQRTGRCNYGDRCMFAHSTS